MVLQVSGLHLHLCFDGQDPPVQVHVVDAPAGAPELDFGVPHVDKVVWSTAGHSMRDQSTAPELLPLLPAWRARSIAPESSNLRTIDWASSESVRTASLELLPPPRGPPLTTRA
jgi:hypothetical protein